MTKRRRIALLEAERERYAVLLSEARNRCDDAEWRLRELREFARECERDILTKGGRGHGMVGYVLGMTSDYAFPGIPLPLARLIDARATWRYRDRAQ